MWLAQKHTVIFILAIYILHSRKIKVLVKNLSEKYKKHEYLYAYQENIKTNNSVSISLYNVWPSFGYEAFYASCPFCLHLFEFS